MACHGIRGADFLQPGESVIACRQAALVHLSERAGAAAPRPGLRYVRGRVDEPGISIPLWLVAGVLGLLGAVSAIAALIEQATTELVLTDRRVIYKTGLPKRHTMEMNRSKVETVSVNQSVLGRLSELRHRDRARHRRQPGADPQIDDPLTFRNHITAG